MEAVEVRAPFDVRDDGRAGDLGVGDDARAELRADALVDELVAARKLA